MAPGSDLKKRARDSEGWRARAAAAASLAAAAPTTAEAPLFPSPCPFSAAAAPSSTDKVPILPLLGEVERPLLLPLSRSARIAPSSAEAASAAREGEGERRDDGKEGGEDEVASAAAVAEEAETSRCLLREEERCFVVVDCSWSVCLSFFSFFVSVS